MQKLMDKLRAHERTVRLTCRVISVAAFVVGVAGVMFDWWLVAAAAIAVLLVTEVLIPRKL